MNIKYTILFLILFISFPQAENFRKYLWFDATANFERLSSPDSIKYYLDKTLKAGFTDVVLDIKPITGEVLYKSRIAPQMTEWNKIKRRTDTDHISLFIREAHKRKFRVHLSINVFVAGHNFFDRGVVYKDHSEWQSLNYTDSGFIPITNLKHKYSAMTNPVNPEVQKYELSLIREIVSKYKNADGLILDRCRFDGIEADFSELSRESFEKYAGLQIKSFPDEIYKWDGEGEKRKKIEGPLYKKWLEWRVSVIYNFVSEARKTAKKINPKLDFQIYAGAWYPVYFDVGVNWGSKKYDPSKDYEWATPQYKNYGYAELLDHFLTGNYFFEVEKEEVEKLNKKNINRTEAGMGQDKEFWYSVEGSAEIVEKVIKNAVPVYAGLYVEQYKDNPLQFRRAIEMCLKKSNGLMIFDIVHLINNNWWEYLK